MSRWLIQGGRVVLPSGVHTADIAVQDGKIASLGPGIKSEQAESIDASGLLIFPGIIDVHTHPVYLDDLGTLPITAAHGGVTTLIHFAYAKPGQGLLETLRQFREEASAASRLDFALHGGLFDPQNQSHEIPQAVNEGVSSHKMFMTYAKLGWMTDDYQLMRTMDILAQAGGMAMVHAENGLATDYLEDKMNAAGVDAKESFLSTRPALLEAEAIHRAIAMARVAGCSLYVVHMTAERGLEVLARARASGCRVYAETCPQYLTLTEAALREQGPLVKIGPPLRDEADRAALWQGLAHGVLDTIASDHAPKAKSLDDEFFAAPFGSPQVETMLQLAYHGGIVEDRLSLPRLVQVMCENPARIFGLYPQKGTLRPGSDADLVLFDPASKVRISHRSLHSKAPYTPYEGMELVGKPILSMQRGEIILDHETIRAREGQGRFLPTQAGRTSLTDLSSRA